MTVHPLFEILQKECPDQIDAVFNQDMCEIDPSFLGFTEAYEALAKLIPKHWAVIDVGCGYGAQSYYFRDHKLYLGTTLERTTCFRFSNSVYWAMTIPEICRSVMGCELKEYFCIMNYVPCTIKQAKLVRETFPNLYCFYPHGEKIK